MDVPRLFLVRALNQTAPERGRGTRGAGVTLLPALSLATEAKRPRLRVRRMASPRAHRTIALVRRKRAPLEPALRELARVLRETFSVAAF
jgi:DNA-binding transcriptional LysR family regulator